MRILLAIQPVLRILLALLPILTFAVLWAIFDRTLGNWRSSLLAASTVWATFLVAITELLSAFRAVIFAAVLAVWILALVATLLWAIRLVGEPRNFWKGWHWPDFSGSERFLLGACALIAVATGAIALIAAPNAFDALTYHLPKVMHWIQDRNVDFYPTHILRQLYLVPGAEYIILHLQMLAGSDRLDNMVQWFSMTGSAIGTSLIAAQLGAGRRGQLLSAVATLTIPMGILQASSTQTDYVTTFWLVCFMSWMLQLREEWSWFSVVVAGASLGLAALTKATTYIFALPFLAWFAVSLLRRYRLRAAGLGVAILLFLFINLPTYVRNERLFGNPLGITVDGTRRPLVSYKLSNDVFTPAILASNVVRNIGSHMGTPFEPVNTFLQQKIIQIHSLIGISVDDPRTTWPQQYFQIRAPIYSEAFDGNLLHSLLVVLSALIVLRQPRRNRVWVLYGLCLLAGFLVFSIYLRWQPYSNRLELPLFVLYAAILGKAADDARPPWIGAAAAAVLLAGALPWLLMNQARPLIANRNILNTDRTSQYFLIRRMQLKDSYVIAAKFIARHKCSRVGLYMDANDWEYPLWVLLQQKTSDPVSIESVNVSNVSRLATGAYPEFRPCAIFVRQPIPSKTFTVNGRQYYQAWTSDFSAVFLPR